MASRATPLWSAPPLALAAKAPAPLRSAGAVQKVVRYGRGLKPLAPAATIEYSKPGTMSVYSIGCTACLSLSLILTSCGKRPNQPTPSSHPPPQPMLVSSSEPGQMGGRIVLPVAGSPKTFNPLLAIDNGSDAVVRFLFGSLLHFDQKTQEPGPGLAESWSVAADQKTWTFKLRRNLRWSDGQPLTAQDVAFTWNEVMYNPNFNRITYGLFQIGGRNFMVTNLDDLTIQVVTPEVYAPFLDFFGGVPVLPRHMLEQPARQKNFLNAYNATTPPRRVVGCGPYRLKELQPGKFTLLERNPEFWMEDKARQRLPYFDEVMIVVTPGPGADANLFLSGKCDACESVKMEQADSFKQRAGKENFTVVDLGIGAERDFLWFNQNTGTNASGKPMVNPAKLKWFRSKKFRQAVSCAIDRERVVREAYGGRAQAAYGFLSSENPKWNNPNVPRYGYDPDRARTLLAEAGIHERNSEGVLKDADGNALEILFLSNFGNPAREKAAALIQEDLGKIGIKLVYLPVPFEMLREKVDVTFDYECAMMGLGGGGADPATQMNVLRSSEDLHQWFPFQKEPSTDWEKRMDALMDAQMRTLDFTERKKAFDEVQVILAEELPMIYTVSPFAYAAIRSKVGNVRPSIGTPYRLTWNMEELFFKKP